MHLLNPALYEINTRVFLRRFSKTGVPSRLGSVPVEYWQSIAAMGFTHIWLMGIWQTTPELIDSCCFQEGLVRSYDKALKDWQPEDVIGSPYSIAGYIPDPAIATPDELAACRNTLHRCGLKLILDFIPNHFSAASPLLLTHPFLFLTVGEATYRQDSHTFFPVAGVSGRFVAHGRDPFFPAWTDTAQVNYCNATARQFMAEQLLAIAEMCDGVRCDMAMLVLNNVFRNTWSGVLPPAVGVANTEFWQAAIQRVTAAYPGFLFIAEAYWNLEWDLQQLGFHFTYDKKLYDRLKTGNAESIRGHLRADMAYAQRLLRFTENHDEERALVAFGREKSLAAAVVIATIPGMRLLHDGQQHGKKIKLPVQLGREPLEQHNEAVACFYQRLTAAMASDVMRFGEWELLTLRQHWQHNNSYQNLLAWQWRLGNNRCLVVVNYSAQLSQCRLQLALPEEPEQITFTDILNGKEYLRSAREVSSQGLFIELPPWQAHLFNY